MNEIFLEENEYYPKKNLYLPTKMIEELQQDADRFEVFKRGDKRNMNGFISCLLCGYYDKYSEERRNLAASIKSMLRNDIQDAHRLSDTTSALLDMLSQRTRNYEKEKKLPHMPYKPTKDTWKIINSIETSSDNTVSSLSKYLRDMFASYLSLPIYEREKIIFKKNVDILEIACTKHSTVSLSSSSEPGKVVRVVCYKLEHSTDEMFNYLLCQGYNDRMGKETPFTLRLCRIQNLLEELDQIALNPEIEKLLDLMNRQTPQYAIYEDVKTRVLLTKDGQKAFSRIYFGRPKPIEPPEELPNGRKIYTFNHANIQLYFYFRRFQANEAIVLEPKSLADDIKAFHEKAWKAYEKGKPIES